MLGMVLKSPRTPLVAEACADPKPGPGELRLRVAACGVCRTDLHVVDAELAPQKSQIIPGHEIVGRVDAIGPGVAIRGVNLTHAADDARGIHRPVSAGLAGQPDHEGLFRHFFATRSLPPTQLSPRRSMR